MVLREVEALLVDDVLHYNVLPAPELIVVEGETLFGELYQEHLTVFID